ncbi:DNA-directed RNA polymerase specialized sigma subunit, sigma24 family [Pedococcus dokdonensis]|uniref:DNA-directed RNA polymerase specialized sigma subunit, sigma24 family n=1 Tax=Pedococcus dokdonensis TaxID=443156 RepID=A0A1H0S0S7_9MICO|nr:sigma-70 family RNA polymerase sigma factor [Pedococcus dokdonensis]SDP35237.1 DNA-directed RNA polymerase specialized sigma subunit, sigma24 family [Pedococcus dokdonensis]
MAERFAEPPSFDEYVVARGSDLLRTAWLLVGDDRAAEELVRTTLRRSWPQWHRLSQVGAGSYDAELRRAVVAGYLRHHHRRPGSAAPATPQADPPSRADLLSALSELGPRERVALVLWTFDGLSDAQVAAALDDVVATAHRHRVHALDRVGGRLGLDEDSLRSALELLPPPDPSVAGLLDQSRPYAARWRGVRGWAFAAVALVVAVAVGGLLAAGEPNRVTPVPSPTATAVTCRTSAATPVPPAVTAEPLSRTVAAVLVCAQTDEGSVWSGFLPPDAPVSAPLAVDALVLAPRTAGAECPALPTGPAFRLLLQGIDGTVRAYANEGLACNGWPALASYYTALAEQGVLDQRAAGSIDDIFLGCPSVLGRTTDASGSARPSLPRGTVLEAATACLHPRPVPGELPKFRPVRANVMGSPQLDQLNADLRRSGSRAQTATVCPASGALFVVEARTFEGRLVELSGSCPDSLSVDWRPRDTWALSDQTGDMLRSLLVAR